MWTNCLSEIPGSQFAHMGREKETMINIEIHGVKESEERKAIKAEIHRILKTIEPDVLNELNIIEFEDECFFGRAGDQWSFLRIEAPDSETAAIIHYTLKTEGSGSLSVFNNIFDMQVITTPDFGISVIEKIFKSGRYKIRT